MEQVYKLFERLNINYIKIEHNPYKMSSCDAGVGLNINKQSKSRV